MLKQNKITNENSVTCSIMNSPFSAPAVLGQHPGAKLSYTKTIVSSPLTRLVARPTNITKLKKLAD